MNYRQLPTQYVSECEFRKTHVSKASICTKMSDITEHVMAVNPRACAQCMLQGKVDDKFIDKTVAQFFVNLLDLALKGFYPDKKDVQWIVETSYPYLKKTKQGKMDLLRYLDALIKDKKLSFEQIEDMMNTTLKELGDEVAPEIHGGGSVPTIKDALQAGKSVVGLGPLNKLEL